MFDNSRLWLSSADPGLAVSEKLCETWGAETYHARQDGSPGKCLSKGLFVSNPILDDYNCCFLLINARRNLWWHSCLIDGLMCAHDVIECCTWLYSLHNFQDIRIANIQEQIGPTYL